MKEFLILTDIKNKTPLFKCWCEEKNIAVGDKYHNTDFMFWVDELSPTRYIELLEQTGKIVPKWIKKEMLKNERNNGNVSRKSKTI